MYEGKGAPAYPTKVMLKIIIFGMLNRVRSCRQLVDACRYDVRFMVMAGKLTPTKSTFCNFVIRHRGHIKDLFKSTVLTCQELSLIGSDSFSVDGTKIEADVSGKATYSKTRQEKEAQDLEATAERLVKELEALNNENTDLFGDTIPAELRDKSARQIQIQKAMASVKAKQRRNEDAKKALENTDDSSVAATDLDSRLMKTKGGNRPAYNAQAVVDAENQVIVAAEVSRDINDTKLLAPMLEQAVGNTGEKPRAVCADTGYAGEDAIRYATENGLDAYIPNPKGKAELLKFTYDEVKDELSGCTSETQDKVFRFCKAREREGRRYRVYIGPTSDGKKYPKEMWFAVKEPDSKSEIAVIFKFLVTMQAKLKSPEGKAVYSKRQSTVEPVFGHIKWVFGLKRFQRRGIDNIRAEYLFACCGTQPLESCCQKNGING